MKPWIAGCTEDVEERSMLLFTEGYSIYSSAMKVRAVGLERAGSSGSRDMAVSIFWINEIGTLKVTSP